MKNCWCCKIIMVVNFNIEASSDQRVLSRHRQYSSNEVVEVAGKEAQHEIEQEQRHKQSPADSLFSKLHDSKGRKDNKPGTLNDNYVLGKAEHSGGFGTVYICQNNTYLVIKVIEVSKYMSQGGLTAMRYLLDEIKNHVQLTKMNCPFSVKIYDFTRLKEIEDFMQGKNSQLDKVYIVSKRVLGLNFSRFIKLKKQCNPLHVVKYFYHVAIALDFMHKHDFVHRDIKPDNIMINEGEGIAELIDFGLSVGLHKHNGSKVGTSAYMHDNLIDYIYLQKDKAFLLDVYALGKSIEIVVRWLETNHAASHEVLQKIVAMCSLGKAVYYPRSNSLSGDTWLKLHEQFARKVAKMPTMEQVKDTLAQGLPKEWLYQPHNIELKNQKIDKILCSREKVYEEDLVQLASELKKVYQSL